MLAEAMNRNRKIGHAHVWLRDDPETGWKGYVCVVCGLSWDVKLEGAQ